ncbi:nuclear condensing complex subunit [Cokeromyces recurvatus]|uniref:nuclear condensing complex subunit n=1 Tax=Cokeromyces recurvatus TaxID=90255 RepID=UPI0022207719|nr:nuclear condensing complex subunit [Cokeromyces recurvatus]XP_051380108.1 nuclear condensing complex subunit [Cokeromyces recurvatus]KAI7899163.1 nuclear condensing complex subunit [Cokeromyces recurvatus]KAI7900123.1 nuclear condensing complex subunit [Cokeromyces recurvatus]
MEKEVALASMKQIITEIFIDAQKSDTMLRSLSIRLRDVQLGCCLNSPKMMGQPEDINFEGEADFIKYIFKMVNVVIKAKRKDPIADRVQRFIAGFIHYIQTKDEEAKTKAKAKRKSEQEQMDKMDHDHPEENNNSEQSVNNDNEDDDEDEEYETISSRFVESLIRHLFRGFSDSKTSIRIRCYQIIALCISSMGELDEDLYQDLKKHLFEGYVDKEASVRAQAATALCRLQTDTEVNRSDGQTIRDKLLWSMSHDSNFEVRQINDFRILSFDQRNKILKWGLNDRNEQVRNSALKMFAEKWLEQAGNNLIEFLERLQATKQPATVLVDKLLKAFFKQRIEVFNDIVLMRNSGIIFHRKAPCLAKIAIEFLQTNNLDEQLEATLPEVTRHVFNLENYFNLYRISIEQGDSVATYEFILIQLLDIALCLDYADEVGRRNMHELLRNILKMHELIDDHLERVLKVFRMISIDERDFTRMKTINQKESKNSENLVAVKRSSQQDTDQNTSVDEETGGDLDNLVMQFRCLNISISRYSNLYGLLNDLIVPAVQSSDPLLRQEGLHCLGLCCMLDKRLAQHNIDLFVTCIKLGHEDLVKIAIRILGDILLMYGADYISDRLTSPDDVRQVFEFGLDHDNTEIQSLTTQALCKLMLFNRYGDDELLRLMVLLYFFPKTVINDFNNTIHQSIPALEELCNIYGDLEKDETMTNPKQISEMLADLSDPRKLVKKTNPKQPSFMDDEEKEAGFDTPGELAIQALQIILGENEGLKRRTMCHFVLKLYLDKAEKEQLIEIQDLIKQINEKNPIKLLPTRKAIMKISENISNILNTSNEQEKDSLIMETEPTTDIDEIQQHSATQNAQTGEVNSSSHASPIATNNSNEGNQITNIERQNSIMTEEEENNDDSSSNDSEKRNNDSSTKTDNEEESSEEDDDDDYNEEQL